MCGGRIPRPVRRDQDDPQLLVRARARGFTPAARDLTPLIDLLLATDAEDDARSIERALGRRADAAPAVALARLTAAKGEAERARLARLLGRLGGEGADVAALAEALAALLGDGSARVRRQAALALGRVGGAAPAAALAGAWDRETEPPVRRAIAEALGKVGGEVALAALEREPAAAPAADPELDRIRARARLTASRTLSRAGESAIDPRGAPLAPVRVALACRAGLERLLADEASAAGFAVASVAPGRVETTLAGPLESLFVLRLHVAATFPLSPRTGAVVPAVVDAVASGEATALFAAFTRGAVRYRIAWTGGGHRRADVWRIARDVAEHRPDLINDPTRSTWQVHVDAGAGGPIAVELEPRGHDDARFAYRVRDVPAASHPTMAAALARLAAAHSERPDRDVIWDPFVGSALELIERARLAPFRRLLGTDIDADALDAARANLAAAGVTAELVQADALQYAPPVAPTVILTNPPMGRRVQRGRAEELLLQLVDRAGQLLAAGGVLCWISPWPGRTRERAAAAGLHLLDARVVDMGGFAAEIQVFRRGPR